MFKLCVFTEVQQAAMKNSLVKPEFWEDFEVYFAALYPSLIEILKKLRLEGKGTVLNEETMPYIFNLTWKKLESLRIQHTHIQALPEYT